MGGGRSASRGGAGEDVSPPLPLPTPLMFPPPSTQNVRPRYIPYPPMSLVQYPGMNGVRYAVPRYPPVPPLQDMVGGREPNPKSLLHHLPDSYPVLVNASILAHLHQHSNYPPPLTSLPPHMTHPVADAFFSTYSSARQHHHHHHQQGMPPPPPPPSGLLGHGAATKKPLSCFNCGQLGHRGTECREASIEEMTRRNNRVL